MYISGYVYYKATTGNLNERILKLEEKKNELEEDIASVVRVYKGKIAGIHNDANVLCIMRSLAKKYGGGFGLTMWGEFWQALENF